MGVRNYLQVIVWYWYILLAGVLVGVVGAGTLTSAMPRSYASEVIMVLAPQQTSGDSALAYEGIRLAMEKVKSYTPLLTSEQLAGDVVRRLRLDLSPVDVIAMTTASLQPDTVLITARVTDTSPERAQRIADALSRSFVTLVDGLERPTDRSSPPLTVKVVQPATFSDVPVSPTPVLNLTLGAILGFLAGLVGALAVNAVRMPIRSVRDITEATGRSVLGVVEADREGPTRPLAVVEQPDGRRADAYRRIANLTSGTNTELGKIVAVVSLANGDGRTVTACNLAVVLARTQRTVVLVDCDLRHPKVSDVLGIDEAGEHGSVGLSDVLEDRAKLESALRPWGREGFLDVLAGGSMSSNPSELVASGNMQRLLTELAQRYEVVLLDTPPIAPVSDAIALSRLGGEVIFVVRRGRTGRKELQGVLESLHAVSARVIGTILNVVPRRVD